MRAFSARMSHQRIPPSLPRSASGAALVPATLTQTGLQQLPPPMGYAGMTVSARLPLTWPASPVSQPDLWTMMPSIGGGVRQPVFTPLIGAHVLQTAPTGYVCSPQPSLMDLQQLLMQRHGITHSITHGTTHRTPHGTAESSVSSSSAQTGSMTVTTGMLGNLNKIRHYLSQPGHESITVTQAVKELGWSRATADYAFRRLSYLGCLTRHDLVGSRVPVYTLGEISPESLVVKGNKPSRQSPGLLNRYHNNVQGLLAVLAQPGAAPLSAKEAVEALQGKESTARRILVEMVRADYLVESASTPHLYSLGRAATPQCQQMPLSSSSSSSSSTSSSDSAQGRYSGTKKRKRPLQEQPTPMQRSGPTPFMVPDLNLPGRQLGDQFQLLLARMDAEGGTLQIANAMEELDLGEADTRDVLHELCKAGLLARQDDCFVKGPALPGGSARQRTDTKSAMPQTLFAPASHDGLFGDALTSSWRLDGPDLLDEPALPPFTSAQPQVAKPDAPPTGAPELTPISLQHLQTLLGYMKRNSLDSITATQAGTELKMRPDNARVLLRKLCAADAMTFHPKAGRKQANRFTPGPRPLSGFVAASRMPARPVEDLELLQRYDGKVQALLHEIRKSPSRSIMRADAVEVLGASLAQRILGQMMEAGLLTKEHTREGNLYRLGLAAASYKP
jgi:DNA-binding IclR family transcriptional regulator